MSKTEYITWEETQSALEKKKEAIMEPKRVMERGKILDEAKKIINGERQDEYGNPEDSHQIIADFWNVYLSSFIQKRTLVASDVMYMMTLFKLARLLGQKYTPDSVRDACGYLGLYADEMEK